MSVPVVSFFEAPVSNTTKSKDLTWEELYNHLTGPPIKLKEASSKEKAQKGSYFIRGIVKNNRSDKDLKTCNIIILDVDKKDGKNKLPTPKQFHKKLSKKNITHAVHSSATKGRCRVILLVKPYKKKNTDKLTYAAWKACQDMGLKFAFAGESKVKSQAWFSPQTTNGNGHQGFGIAKGINFKPSKKLLKASKKAFSPDTKKDKWDRDKFKGGIKTGTPMERFVESLESGTIHQAAKEYAGWQTRISNSTKKQIFDDMSVLIKKHYEKAGFEDKLERWENKERSKLEDWYDDQDFQSNMDNEGVTVNSADDFESQMGNYNMTAEYLDGLGKEKFCYDNLVIERHVLTIIATPGGGKTAFFVGEASRQMAKRGYSVYYLDADSPPSEHKRMNKLAHKGGFSIKIADAVGGNGPQGLLDILKGAAENDIDLENKVFIIDTLKKFTDLMSKGSVRDFYQLMRKLTGLGATIVLLGHANKRREKDGLLLFEGTNDVRADTDELIYFEISDSNPDKITVTTVVDQNKGAKVRGIFEPFSFEVNKKGKRGIEVLDNVVSPVEYGPMGGKGQAPEEKVIKAIKDAIKEHKPIKTTALVEIVCGKINVGKNRVEKILHLNGSKSDDGVFKYKSGKSNAKIYV